MTTTIKLIVIILLLAITPATAQNWSSNAYGEALCGAVSCLTGSEAAGLNRIFDTSPLEKII